MILYFILYFIVAGVVAHFLHRFFESTLDNKDYVDIAKSYFKFDATTRESITLILSVLWLPGILFMLGYLTLVLVKTLLGGKW